MQLHDGTFPGRVGWKAILALPGAGTAVRSSAPSRDPTNGLRAYPKDLLTSPYDQRGARFSVRPGSGTLVAPRGPGQGDGDHRRTARATGWPASSATRPRAAACSSSCCWRPSRWGALHALSPGHGKAMVAAYLVGARGTARHAVALGGVVTLTHTIGVFALGLVTLALSQYVLPEDLYPWLNLASGLLVVLVGAAVLRARLRTARHRHAHEHGHHHHHHDHGHGTTTITTTVTTITSPTSSPGAASGRWAPPRA